MVTYSIYFAFCVQVPLWTNNSNASLLQLRDAFYRFLQGPTESLASWEWHNELTCLQGAWAKTNTQDVDVSHSIVQFAWRNRSSNYNARIFIICMKGFSTTRCWISYSLPCNDCLLACRQSKLCTKGKHLTRDIMMNCLTCLLARCGIHY